VLNLRDRHHADDVTLRIPDAPIFCIHRADQGVVRIAEDMPIVEEAEGACLYPASPDQEVDPERGEGWCRVRRSGQDARCGGAADTKGHQGQNTTELHKKFPFCRRDAAEEIKELLFCV
jgi:hypothetical protein